MAVFAEDCRDGGPRQLLVAATGGDAECGRALPGADLFGETMLLARD